MNSTYYVNVKCFDKQPNAKEAFECLSVKKICNIKDVYEIFHRLYKIRRRGFIEVENYIVENNMEHMYKVAVLCLFIIHKHELDIDCEKVLKHALLHDIAEAYTGDIIPNDKIDSNFRHSLEIKIGDKMFEDQCMQGLKQALHEHITGEDQVDKFVRLIDKLEFLYEYRDAIFRMAKDRDLVNGEYVLVNFANALSRVENSFKNFKIKNYNGKTINLYEELILPIKNTFNLNPFFKS